MDAQLPRGPTDVTERQLEVARLVAEGRTNPEIATTLGITLDGAKYHVSELLGRLNLQRREEIADWYRTHRGAPLTRARRRLRAMLGLPLVSLTTAGGAAVGVALVLVAFAVLNGADEARVIDTAHGRWEVLEPPPVPLYGNFAVPLDGRYVLLGGGQEEDFRPGPNQLNTRPQPRTWILDLETETYEELPELDASWGFVGSVRRPDGSVLIAGGVESRPDEGLRSLDGQLLEWDPGSRAFTVLEDEQLDRVVAVGTDEDGFPLLLSQSSHTFTLLRERSRGAFEAVASVDLAQSQNTSAVVGRHVVIATMEDLGIIDSATGEVTRVPGAMLDRVVLTAPVMLDDHRALLTGGFETPEWFAWIEATMRDMASGSPPGAGNTAETLASKRTFLVDAASGTIEESMELTGSGRVNHVVAPLGDGRVLVVGGVPSISGGPTPLPAMAPILHDPSAGTSIALTDAPRVGFFPTATPLLDGSVLFTGTNPVENDPGEAKGLAIRFIPVTP